MNKRNKEEELEEEGRREQEQDRLEVCFE